MAKAIITCAVTGSVHTPSMSPYLPITPDEIAQAAIGAAEAGAAIIHLHARDPETGRPTQDPDVYQAYLPTVAAATDAVLNITTGGSPILPLEERLAPAARFQPEVASLNMGSMKFGMYEMLNRFKTFKHDWERPYLEGTVDLVFRNSFRDIQHILESCKGNGTRFEFECYDVSHLYNLAHFVDQKIVEGPLFIQTVFGTRGGTGTHFEDVAMMKRTADRLFGQHFIWSVLGTGKMQMPLAAMGAAMGGNVRVGLEDSLWDSPGKLAESNAHQVRRIRTILEALSIEVATPDEARRILQLKGRDKVKI